MVENEYCRFEKETLMRLLEYFQARESRLEKVSAANIPLSHIFSYS